jgi:hypothetical protein
MAPRVLATPRDPAHRERMTTVDERILAQRAQRSPTDQEHESNDERRSCFYCLEGWVFLGSIGHEGEEVYESMRCRRCGGTGGLV